MTLPQDSLRSKIPLKKSKSELLHCFYSSLRGNGSFRYWKSRGTKTKKKQTYKQQQKKHTKENPQTFAMGKLGSFASYTEFSSVVYT